MRRKLIVALGIAACVAVPVAIGLLKQPAGREAELARVEQREIHATILATGQLVFRQEVQLSAEVIGKVAAVLVKEGDSVRKGQSLLRLDPTVYQAEVAQQEASRRSASIAIERAQISLANQQRGLDRAQRLYQARFIDVSKYDDAVHQVELAQVELRASREALGQADALLSQARERLAKTEVRAPIDGTVTELPIKVGETAVASTTGIAGSSLMTIADMAAIVAEVNVDEADIAQVAVGQGAKVFPAAYPEQPIGGRVERIAMAPRPAQPGAAAEGRSYVVRLRLDDTRPALRSGMTSRVEIAAGATVKRPAIPLQALLSEADGGSHEAAGQYVFAVVDGRAAKRAVQVGLSDDTSQEVLEGVGVGDTVAVGPARLLRELRDGDLVIPLKAVLQPGAAR
ncbi:efflux RND transporter periplasmic adaptor subunit [Massilia dura]|uniref:Efflux RND transporter periplasmic adaptor subunit n=1 Tax=Pseudoduganella dura TaxID=321982 RepID=A0A6I3XI61_9BURK|nr:efflux RND transporter periplasmic adaptor subunit [Pseudoduganella dura]MUI16227.1 efflux RND transporter periplasmic adaptor subunit [Pseudoduganella dura]GGY04969.1 RND transporter [Pseudoduganella dura]